MNLMHRCTLLEETSLRKEQLPFTRKLKSVAVAGIPKTIDNDIAVIDKSFGFDTAVEEAQREINAAHVDVESVENGGGIIKLMGRYSGFIAMLSTLASRDVGVAVWRQMPPERKAGVVVKIGSQFDLRPHIKSDRWPQIHAAIQQHLQKLYNGKKAALRERRSIVGSQMMALAIAFLCFCPPDSCTPCSPHSVTHEGEVKVGGFGHLTIVVVLSLSSDWLTYETIPLTVDQKPDREDELLRIEEQDGKVIYWHGARVLGVLAMSRAIGDRYLRPWIIPVPEITFTTRTDEDECLIIATDGLWDVMTNNEVGEVARRILRRKRRSAATNDEPSAAQTLADSLTEIAMGRLSSDNISVVVVDLKSKKKQQKK
nr:probable protein phosphatase 2C 6 [Tanacetum cinerariifolium]